MVILAAGRPHLGEEVLGHHDQQAAGLHALHLNIFRQAIEFIGVQVVLLRGRWHHAVFGGRPLEVRRTCLRWSLAIGGGPASMRGGCLILGTDWRVRRCRHVCCVHDLHAAEAVVWRGCGWQPQLGVI